MGFWEIVFLIHLSLRPMGWIWEGECVDREVVIVAVCGGVWGGVGARDME